MKIEENILSTLHDYDVFFVDMYGVLFDGMDLYPDTLETLAKLRQHGKKVIILSNATQMSIDARIGYAQKGMRHLIHYDEFITSGEYLKNYLLNNLQDLEKMAGKPIKTIKRLFTGNVDVFENSGIQNVENYQEADLIYVGIPRASYGAVRVDNLLDVQGAPIPIENIIKQNWHEIKDCEGRKGFAEFAKQLEICLKSGKTLLVANPDIFAHCALDDSEKRYPILTQGCIGAYYEYVGGKVIYCGKPYRGIFDYALQFASTSERCAMVGDTPWTDIAGANRVGIDSVMTLTGIAGEFLTKLGSSKNINEKIEMLLGDITAKMLRSPGESVTPQRIIKKFAAS